jgi:hypothetical protein
MLRIFISRVSIRILRRVRLFYAFFFRPFFGSMFR